ncbi:hypothetical protein ACQP2E_37895 [Actinoplanes sp. CA-015351]|uniref:hypothetical protein n=1 Tax=Actinoplanes sp. CA-015351 TaxID=3239897 RepID=UPI003D97C0C1
MRAIYPTASTEGLTRLTTQTFARAAVLRGSLTAITGPSTAIAAIGITHAELVLHLAAIHGLDPTDTQRAEDILACAPLEQPAKTLAAYAAIRYINRALPGTSLLSTILAGHNTIAATATKARKLYTRSQSSQLSGSS